MDSERLEQLKDLVGKKVKNIAIDVDLENEDKLDMDSEGFDLIFTDGTRLEVYDLRKHGLGWCISGCPVC